MTGKLIKYEIRSGIRLIAIIWAALLAASILVGFSTSTVQTVLPEDGLELAKSVLSIVPPILYGAIFMAMLVITVMIIVLRFYRGLLGDEGYLMHTLPVKEWQLITAKGVVAAGIVLVSSLVAILSILILVGFTGGFRDMMDAIGELFRVFGEEPQIILFVLEALVIMIASVLKSVYQIYAAMAIGQLAGKYRLLTSLGAYIVISIALTIIVAVVVAIGDVTGFATWLGDFIADYLANQERPDRAFALGHAGMAVAFFLTAVQVVVFHVIAERIMTKKLNLI